MYLRQTDILNCTIAMIGIMSCASMLLILLTTGRKEKTTKTYMAFAFISLLSYNICLFSFVLLQKNIVSKFRTLVVILLGFGTYIFGVVTAFIVSSYVAYLVKPQGKVHKRIQSTLLIMLILFFVTLVIMQCTGNLVQIDEAGTYSEGPFSFIGHVMVAFYMVFDLLMLVRFRKNISLHQRRILCLYIGLPMFATVLRQFVNGVYIVALSSSLSVSLFMIVSVIEQADKYRQQELKNEQLKIDILLSQIQPHFLFNVLYVIQEICHTDPETASVAIEKFSRYLRHNMDSIAVNRPIPFSEELEHTKSYVQLQQLRFGEVLDVNYNLTATDFRMPSLALQPIVENAIRYGVRQNEKGAGTIEISTKETNDHYEIVVTDNGPGFDLDKLPDDGATHVGLKNVRERLHHISNGDLRIESTFGEGTKVTILLPKEAQI